MPHAPSKVNAIIYFTYGNNRNNYSRVCELEFFVRRVGAGLMVMMVMNE